MATETHETLATATCLSCGYSLRGLSSGACPECGRGFDSNDPRTFNDPRFRRALQFGRRIARWQRWCAGPSRTECAFVVFATALLLAATHGLIFRLGSEPQSRGDLLGYTLFTAAWGVLCWTIFSRLRADYALRNLRRALPASSPPQRGHARATITAGCCLLALILYLWPLTTTVRFVVSRDALQRAASVRIAAGDSLETPQYIGLFRVNGIYLHNGGQVFFNLTGGNGWMPTHYRSGLLYGPNGHTWSGPGQRQALDNNWSLASYEAPYPAWRFVADLLTFWQVR